MMNCILQVHNIKSSNHMHRFDFFDTWCRSIVTELADEVQVNRSRNVVIKIWSWVYRELCLQHGCSVGHAILTIISCGHASSSRLRAGGSTVVYVTAMNCNCQGDTIVLTCTPPTLFCTWTRRTPLQVPDVFSFALNDPISPSSRFSRVLREIWYSTWHSIDFNCSIVINAYIFAEIL